MVSTVSMEQIAAGLAHEIKNPIALVRANLDYLELEEEGNHKKNFLIMRRELDKVNDLMLDFITLMKPGDYSQSRVKIHSLLWDAVDAAKTAYGAKIQFEYKTDSPEINVLCDKKKLSRVFANILKNAVEAVQAGNPPEPAIEIVLRQSKRLAKIIIADNGVGLTPNELKSISQPFYTTKSGGSGLGLFLCRSFLSDCGGTLKINGKEGNGCTVTVTLPLG